MIRRGAILQPEGDAQRILLRAGEPVEPVEHGRAQLMQPCEWELHLGFDARRPHDVTSRRALDAVLQQRRLADPRFAAQDQHPALTGAHASHQTIERVALAASAEQSARSIAIRHCHRRA